MYRIIEDDIWNLWQFEGRAKWQDKQFVLLPVMLRTSAAQLIFFDGQRLMIEIKRMAKIWKEPSCRAGGRLRYLPCADYCAPLVPVLLFAFIKATFLESMLGNQTLLLWIEEKCCNMETSEPLHVLIIVLWIKLRIHHTAQKFLTLTLYCLVLFHVGLLFPPTVSAL